MKALITWGGWDGHEPDKVAKIFESIVTDAGGTAEVTNTLACFDDPDKLKTYDLIIPVWTMSDLSRQSALAVHHRGQLGGAPGR